MAAPYSLRPVHSGLPWNAVALAWQKDQPKALFNAVANTHWGKIPGKANDSTCWFPYGGKEQYTKDFSWLVSEKDSVWLWKNDGSGPPAAALCIGNQTDGAGNLYAAIARTQHGTIPGKAKGDTCWYPYGGKEEYTKDFDWLVCADVWFEKKKKPGPPPRGVQLGHQSDGAGALWCGVANTQWGTIPGKAKDNTCWFPYGGKEQITQDFAWVIINKGCSFLESSDGSGPPYNALKVGHQTDGSGDLYSAVAKTDWGLIPGKAKQDTCWYPYGGKEHYTKNFFWVVSWKLNVSPRSELRLPRGRNEVDVIVQMPSHGRPIARAVDRGDSWRLAATVIAMWDSDVAPSTTGILASLSDLQMVNEGQFQDGRGWFVNLVIQQGGLMFAKGVVQTGVNFGRKMIRRCLAISLQNQAVATLCRQAQ